MHVISPTLEIKIKEITQKEGLEFVEAGEQRSSIWTVVVIKHYIKHYIIQIRFEKNQSGPPDPRR